MIRIKLKPLQKKIKVFCHALEFNLTTIGFFSSALEFQAVCVSSQKLIRHCIYSDFGYPITRNFRCVSNFCFTHLKFKLIPKRNLALVGGNEGCSSFHHYEHAVGQGKDVGHLNIIATFTLLLGGVQTASKKYLNKIK